MGKLRPRKTTQAEGDSILGLHQEKKGSQMPRRSNCLLQKYHFYVKQINKQKQQPSQMQAFLRWKLSTETATLGHSGVAPSL